MHKAEQKESGAGREGRASLVSIHEHTRTTAPATRRAARRSSETGVPIAAEVGAGQEGSPEQRRRLCSAGSVESPAAG